jgi:hypothetical protein
MQETKTNPLGIRVTDADLRRLEAIKAAKELPSMANTTLAHDLLLKGMELAEKQYKLNQYAEKVAAPAREKQTAPKKKAARRGSKSEAAHV